MNYSTQYFAVYSVILILTFIPLFLGRFGWRSCTQLFRKHWFAIGLCLIATIPIVLLYGYYNLKGLSASAGPKSYSISFMSLKNILMPMFPARSYNELGPIVPYLREFYDHERPAYLGMLPLMMLLAMFASGLAGITRLDLVRFFRTPATKIFLVTACFIAVTRSKGELAGLIAWGVTFGCLIYGLYQLGKLSLRSLHAANNILLLSLSFVTYGVCLGYGKTFSGVRFDPSLFTIFNLMIPGLEKMRAICRTAPIGQLMLFEQGGCIS